MNEAPERTMNKLQALNTTIADNGGVKVADNEADTEAIFRFPTEDAAERTYYAATDLGAYARQFDTDPRNVFLAIR